VPTVIVRDPHLQPCQLEVTWTFIHKKIKMPTLAGHPNFSVFFKGRRPELCFCDSKNKDVSDILKQNHRLN